MSKNPTAVAFVKQAQDTLDTLFSDLEQIAVSVGRDAGGRVVALAKTKAEEVGHRLEDALKELAEK